MSISCYKFRFCNLAIGKKVHFLALPHHSCCLVSTSWLLQQRILFHIWIKIMQNLWQICNIRIISSPPTQSKQVIQMVRLQTEPPPVGSHVPANSKCRLVGRWWSYRTVLWLPALRSTHRTDKLYLITWPQLYKMCYDVFLHQLRSLEIKQTFIQNSPWTTSRPWAVLRTRVPGLLAAHT